MISMLPTSLILPRPLFASHNATPCDSSESLPSQAELLDTLIREVKAPQPFSTQARQLMAQHFPPSLLRDILNENYEIHLKQRLHTDRPDLHTDYDYMGGLHETGPQGNRILVAAQVMLNVSNQWVAHGFWQNSLVHEVGHVACNLLGAKAANEDDASKLSKEIRKHGITEHPDFKAAWQKDFDAIPYELKCAWLDGLTNRFQYFLYERNKDGFRRARQETFAEIFDILLRGKDSSFNYKLFNQYFRNALVAARDLTLRYYPDLHFQPLSPHLDRDA